MLKKNWKWVAAFMAVLLLLLVSLSPLWWQSREPAYQGQTFSYWFHQALTSHVEAMTAIQSMGGPAVPLLMREIEKDDSWGKNFYYRNYWSIPLGIRRFLPLPIPPGGRQMMALNLLNGMGKPVREYVPRLIQIYNHYYIRQYDLRPHSKIDWSGQFAHPPEQPKTPVTALQIYLLKTITEFGTDDPEIVPLILASYAQKMPVWLPEDYANLGVALRQSEPLLLAHVSHPDPAVRQVVIGMLATLAPEHPEFRPIFVKATEETNLYLQHLALKGLQATQPEFEPALPILARMLAETNQLVTDPARVMLMGLGGGLKMFARLNDALASPNAAVRAAAAQLLRDYPRRAEIARTRLMEHTNAAVEPDEAVRREAAATLGRMKFLGDSPK